MLRECVKHEPLAKLILESEEFFRFYSYVEVSTFDIASDAFATFKVKELLFNTCHATFYKFVSRHETFS